MGDFSLEQARSLDQADILAVFRNRFLINNPDEIYLLGNSLGRLAESVKAELQKVVEDEWGSQLIQSWNADWYNMPIRIGDALGQLLGAKPGQVIVADSTSVNLFKVVTTLLAQQKGQNEIISDTCNFPSDLYVLQGIVDARPELRLTLIDHIGDLPAEDEICQKITTHTALVVLSHVAFKSGARYNIEKINQKARQAGALVIWDFSHSVGVLPLHLDDWQVDGAVGCTYKYLNAGPGAPAFLYVRSELQAGNPWLQGWFGQNKPFEFEAQYSPAIGMRRFLTGTPSILSMSAIEPSVHLILEAGIQNVYRKAQGLTDYFLKGVAAMLSEFDFSILTPINPELRGGHVTLCHPDARKIAHLLINEKKVIVDFRAEDAIRFGFSPLYNSFEEVFLTVQRLCDIMQHSDYKGVQIKSLPVT